jgi:hypothetical protein
MLPVGFVFVAAAFNVAGSTVYVSDTLRGHTQPNRVTWLLWAVAPLIAFAAELQEGVGLVALMTFMVGIGPLAVLLASFVNRRGYARLTRFDLACGSLSIVALVAWRVTGQGTVAIFFSLLADFLAAVPTIRKSYAQPHTETSWSFLCAAISAAITLLTVTEWTFAVVAFPLYLLVVGALMFAMVRFPEWRPRRVAA